MAIHTVARAAFQSPCSTSLSDLLGDSPLDKPISVTFFPNVRAESLEKKQISLRQLAGAIGGQAGATDRT